MSGCVISLYTPDEHQVMELGEFLTANQLSSEELDELFAAFADQRPHFGGGGAALRYAVRRYDGGDEDLELNSDGTALVFRHVV